MRWRIAFLSGRRTRPLRARTRRKIRPAVALEALEARWLPSVNLVRDINTAAFSSAPHEIANLNGVAYREGVDALFRLRGRPTTALGVVLPDEALSAEWDVRLVAG